MSDLMLLFSLKPILYGFIGMMISGFCFPLAGVIIIRNDLIPIRYMLMHGIILGGILSIAFDLPLMISVIVLNLLLVLIIHKINVTEKVKLSSISTMLMVLTMGLASLCSHIFDVPSKDMLELLWGSPFALTKSNLIILITLSVGLLIYIIAFFKPISLIFFDTDIAKSIGVNVNLHKFIMLLITSLVISVSMKMIGALLIDALVILPVVSISKNAKSLKGLFVLSSVTGLIISFISYLLALIWNLPVSGVIAVLSVIVFIISNIVRKIKK